MSRSQYTIIVTSTSWLAVRDLVPHWLTGRSVRHTGHTLVYSSTNYRYHSNHIIPLLVEDSRLDTRTMPRPETHFQLV